MSIQCPCVFHGWGPGGECRVWLLSHSFPMGCLAVFSWSWPSKRTNIFLHSEAWRACECPELCALSRWKWNWVVTLWSGPTLVFFFLFSFGRTSFLQKDCSLWRRRLSCVKASTRLPSQNGVPVTQPLMFGQLKCFCPKAAGSKWLIHPVRFFSS